jgi:1-acyl-sn-glycerol-3-phosphate acyltransferase
VRRPEPWFWLAEFILRPPIALWFNWRFEGMEHIPREGPVLVACNHISYLDPLAHAYMLVRAGRRPRFLAKRELYGNAFVRRVLLGAGQIPVERGSRSAAPVEAAAQAIREGQAVMVYPEGTITRNTDSTPMEGRTGIARLTLVTGVPVLPIAIWGSHQVWQRGGLKSLAFGRPIWLKAGPRIEFSQLEGRTDDPEALRVVTGTVMESLADLVEDLRSRYPARWRSASDRTPTGRTR